MDVLRVPAGTRWPPTAGSPHSAPTAHLSVPIHLRSVYAEEAHTLRLQTRYTHALQGGLNNRSF